MSEILLIRHTKPDIPSGLCYGQTDVPYEREDFENWRNQHPWPSSYRVYSSPLRRCHDLALKALSGPICLDARLMELHFGEWEKKLWHELPRQDTERWTSDYLNEAPPGGETLIALTLRLQSFFAELETGERVKVLFSHAGVIRLLLCASHGEGIDQYFVRPVEYGSMFRLPRRPEAIDFDRLLRR